MFFIFLISFSIFKLSLQAIDVVIIGGGPAGLATAIEGHLAGANVLIIEKKDTYTRNQLLFLFDYSLKLLEKWEIAIPSMQIAKLEYGHLMGTTKIKDLEVALKKRVDVLGIQMMQSEFIGIGMGSVTIFRDGIKREIAYDTLVGADGAHSLVRDALGICCKVFGKANAIAAVIPFPNVDNKAELLPANFQDSLFIKRIFFPAGRVLILQYPLVNAPLARGQLNQKRLIAEAQKANWIEEADGIAEGKSFITPEIYVTLQQALEFSDLERAAILVGDAAATAPFCEAMGANTALKTAEIAGELLAKLTKDKNQNYLKFNIDMKETTDALIWNSLYLVYRAHSS